MTGVLDKNHLSFVSIATETGNRNGARSQIRTYKIQRRRREQRGTQWAVQHR